MSALAPLHVVAAAILDGRRCLVARRAPNMPLAGHWEFPGGKVKRGERPEAALAREIEEEFGARPDVGARLGTSDWLQAGRRMRLELYEAALGTNEPRPREHDAMTWAGADELDAFEWAPADVPLLPALRGRLREPEAALPRDTTIVSVDWSRHARRRAAWVGRVGGGWLVAQLAPPTGGWNLAALLDVASRLRREHGSPVLLGIDAALGVPHAIARALGEPTFRGCLERWARSGALEAVCERARDWTSTLPFFRVPAGAGGLTDFVAAAGGRSGLLRQVELSTGAKPVFAVSGIPGTVGSGSRALWRELMPVADLPLWPFDGRLAALLGGRAIALAETYPRASYSIALDDAPDARLRPVAKTHRDARTAAIERMLATQWVARHGVRFDGLDTALANEDDFDAALTAAALVRSMAEPLTPAFDPVDDRTEGGIACPVRGPTRARASSPPTSAGRRKGSASP